MLPQLSQNDRHSMRAHVARISQTCVCAWARRKWRVGANVGNHNSSRCLSAGVSAQVRGILASPGLKAQLETAGEPRSDRRCAAADPWQAMQPPAVPPPAAAAAGEHFQLCSASPQPIARASLCVGPQAAGACFNIFLPRVRADDGCGGGIDWEAAGVPAGTVPKGVLGFLSRASADEGCQLLCEWAADGDGCPGISEPPGPGPEQSPGAALACGSGFSCDESPTAARSLGVQQRAEVAQRSGAPRERHQSQSCCCRGPGSLCGRHQALRGVLVAFGQQFIDNLEALLQVPLATLAPRPDRALY